MSENEGVTIFSGYYGWHHRPIAVLLFQCLIFLPSHNDSFCSQQTIARGSAISVRRAQLLLI